MIFQDSPEYVRRIRTPFKPTSLSLAEIRGAVPKHLHQKNTIKALGYVFRDVLSAFVAFKLAWMIEPLVLSLAETYDMSSVMSSLIKWSLWSLYWYAQGILLTGWWCLAHEAGHGNLSDYNWVNHTIGFSLHTVLMVPYWAWRSTHRTHHKASASLERDENFVPRTRSDFNLPEESQSRLSDYHEIFEEAPFYTLMRIMLMQSLGWPAYMLRNEMGSPKYPPGTNHLQPSSPLFKPHERIPIIICNISLIIMSLILTHWAKQVGFAYFVKLFMIPYLVTNHWIIMLTYLQHSDPTIPHYRERQWTFVRGALSTVDRPLLGFIGRFYLHNISHDHIAHHFFSSTPFYNQPLVTEHLKKVLRDDYYYDSTNTFRALYRTFTQCMFVEDSGDILFYKDKHGNASRVLAPDALSMEQPPVENDSYTDF